HQLHREVRPAGVRRAAGEHPRDVDMVHQGESLALGLEAGDDLAAFHAGLDDLQGDRAPDRLSLFRQPDNAHASLADLRDELVGTNYGARALGQLEDPRSAEPDPDLVAVQDTVLSGMGLEEHGYLLLQALVAGAGFGQQRFPLRLRLLHNREE